MGRKREGEREIGREYQACSMLNAESDAGLNPMILGSLPEHKSRVGHSLNRLKHPGTQYVGIS